MTEREEEPEPYESDLTYMQDELEWIEARARRIQIDQKLEESMGDQQVGGGPGGWTSNDMSLDELWSRKERLESKESELRERVDTRLEAMRRDGEPPALDQLVEMYGLDDFERTIVLLAASRAFSQRFHSLFSELAGEFGYALSVEAVFNFCELSFAERIERRKVFARSGALRSNDLISLDSAERFDSPEDLLGTGIELSSRTFAFLIGDDSLADEFLEFSSVEEPIATFDQVVLDDEDKRRIRSVIDQHGAYLEKRREWGFDDVISYGRGALMLFYGKPGTGKTMTAHAVADAMDKRVLNVDIPTFVSQHEAEHFLPGLFREAQMKNALLFFDECEELFGDRRRGNALMTMLLTELERFEGVAILATNLPRQLDEALERRILIKVEFPEPDRVARRDIWDKHLPDEAPVADEVDLQRLADRFEMTGGLIKNAVLTAVADAVHRGADDPEIDMASLERAARRQVETISEGETPVVDPSVRLEDVVLPEETRDKIEELIEASRNRRQVLERWGIGEHLSYGKGLSALFAGEPGTGKTMCAEAIANELNRPLLVGSIPALKSKWVGETEKNLDQLFRDAKAHNAILFLDEADSLLMERGEQLASRHDDSAVNVLLGELERHNDLVLMASNRPDALDPALDRRLTYQLTFPHPDAELRARIWETLLPDDVPREETIDVGALGEQFPLTGGRIKNAVFKAAFRAARTEGGISMELLREAADEEMDDDGESVGFRSGD